MGNFIFMLALPVFMMLCSCTVSPVDSVDNQKAELWGTWISTDEDMWEELKRANELHEDKYGIIINKNGTLTERNPGPCGTPPLTYSNHEGTWVMENDTILIVKFKSNWYKEKKIIILELTNEKLILEQEITKYDW